MVHSVRNESNVYHSKSLDSGVKYKDHACIINKGEERELDLDIEEEEKTEANVTSHTGIT